MLAKLGSLEKSLDNCVLRALNSSKAQPAKAAHLHLLKKRAAVVEATPRSAAEAAAALDIKLSVSGEELVAIIQAAEAVVSSVVNAST